eukprot:TRINITY_DN61935_c0_g1_i1.p1 TRINITY_DN61935_c0_g1~~TRINITY_DN61935_c0_g1_i1.p1  ORF type:complete len:627 (-),score=123.41 TRINITY_DN61935_c0_g1_i1:96-1976(-)
MSASKAQDSTGFGLTASQSLPPSSAATQLPRNDCTVMDPLASVRASIKNGLDEDYHKASEAWDLAESGLKQRLRGSKRAQAQDHSHVKALALTSPKVGARPPLFSSSASLAPRCYEQRPNHVSPTAAELESVVQARRELKARKMRVRASETAVKMKDHGKRALRKKITDICHDVDRRQKLRQQQEKAREARERICRREPPSSLGDATEEALGLLQLSGSSPIPQECVSPRRALILENLSLAELDEVRRDARFFLSGVIPAEEEEEDEPVQAQDYSGMGEDILDFFTPSKAEKELPISEFARKLKAKATPHSSFNEAATGPTKEERLAMAASREPLTATDMMPSLGRRAGVRDNMQSPTLMKVREVYRRRDAMDAKNVKEKQEEQARRDALNSFKVYEQQREMKLQTVNQQELHKLRVLEAEERKMLREAEMHDIATQREAEAAERLAKGCLKAAVEVHNKRMAATMKLESWHDQVVRSERHLQRVELARSRAAERTWEVYTEKLWKVGMDRHAKLTSQGHAQKNDKLKSAIQNSLVQQLEEQRKRDSESLKRQIEEKQSAAALRREKKVASRYNFVEEAFGPEATGFDHKHHTFGVDRRNPTWLQNAEAWSQEKKSYSEPALGQTS